MVDDDLGVRMTALEGKLDRLTESVDGLVTAWKMATFALGVAKWSAGIVASLVGVWVGLIKLRGGPT